MLDFCAQLADHSYRYRKISIQQIYPATESRDTHTPIMKAALDGDAAKAVGLLQMHLRFTADTILRTEGMLSGKIDHPKGRRAPSKNASSATKARKRMS